MRRAMLALSLFLGATAFAASASAQQNLPSVIPNGQQFPNERGASSSFSTQGAVDRTGAFFQPMGTNQRTCETCHLAGDGWTISARSAKQIFEQSDGLAPLFDFDGQNCIGADRSTRAARRRASSLMIDKALVRLEMDFPVDGEIEIIDAQGTYCNPTTATKHFVFRRPLPTVNFGALGTVLWDGRGNGLGPTPNDGVAAIVTGATMLHEQTTVAPTPEQVASATAFMLALTNAQIVDNEAGRLDRQGALGGAQNLAMLPLAGGDFNLFDAFAALMGTGARAEARRQVARGQAVFNGVGSCSSCHDVSNQGNQTGLQQTVDLGISAPQQRTPDLPLFTLRNKLTGEIRQTSDAGLAITTGLWADIDKFKVPMLRGLAARAPYFHNGTAEDLEAVVDFYDEILGLGLSTVDRRDLVAFLETL